MYVGLGERVERIHGSDDRIDLPVAECLMVDMEYEQTLTPGTILNDEFRIKGLLGSGGFANTYLAEDLTLGREVAIKEFFPAELAVRANSKSVSVKSNAQTSQFEWARSRFVREAKTLAKFLHPSVVRVFRVFDANNTAYIVLEFVHGANMGTWLKRLQRPPTQDEFDVLLPPLLDALEVVHRAGILHRDIKPANIYIREIDNVPVLLDFGAAKYATAADNAGTTAAIVSKGYSPNEAYSTDTRLQGPWTDIYGLSATVYRGLTGSAPPESTSRIMHDECVMTSARPELQGHYRPEFLDAIDGALAIMPRDRPQSIAAWREQLFPDLALLQPQNGPLGYGPTSDSGWHPLTDGPSGTETIYSAPKSPSVPGRSGSRANISDAKANSTTSEGASAANSLQARSAGELSEVKGQSQTPVSKVPSLLAASQGLSFATRTVRRLVTPPEGSSNAMFFAGVGMLVVGAMVLGLTVLQPGDDRTNSQASNRASIERVALLEAAERKRIAEEKRQGEEAAERRRIAEEKRQAEEVAERKRIAEEKRQAAEAAERKRIAEEKRQAAEAAERKRIAEEKRQAEEAAERKRIAEEKRQAAEAVERKRIAEEKRQAVEAAERKRVAEEKRQAAEAAERKRIAEEKRQAEEAAERKRIAEEKRLANEKRQAAEAAERKQLAEAKQRAEDEARARLSGPPRTVQEASAGAQCGGLYDPQIISRCEISQPHRLCGCAADLELAERRYQRQAAVLTSLETGQPPIISHVAPANEELLPSEEVRRTYLTEIQTQLKQRQCYKGTLNGQLEDTQTAMAEFSSSNAPKGPTIELASATKGEYEDLISWFRKLDNFVCIPLAPKRPRIVRTEPAETDDETKSSRLHKRVPKTLQKRRTQRSRSPSTNQRSHSRTKPKRKARRSAQKPKAPSNSGASYNNLLRGGR